MMQILRKTNSNNAYPQPFLDALFTFVSYLLQTQPGGQMLMSAGIIPTLVQIVGNHQYTQLKNVAKVVGLVDTIVNSFATSFSAFCNANGLDILLNRIKVRLRARVWYISVTETCDAVRWKSKRAPRVLRQTRISSMQAARLPTIDCPPSKPCSSSCYA